MLEPPKKKQKRNKPTLSCEECVERKTKVSYGFVAVQSRIRLGGPVGSIVRGLIVEARCKYLLCFHHKQIFIKLSENKDSTRFYGS
jgi:hypothetical protein